MREEKDRGHIFGGVEYHLVSKLWCVQYWNIFKNECKNLGFFNWNVFVMFWVYTKYFISKLFELRRKYCSLRYWLLFMLNLGIAEFLEKVVKVLGVIFLHLTLLVYMTKKVNASFKLQILECNKLKIQNTTLFLFTITCSNTFSFSAVLNQTVTFI